MREKPGYISHEEWRDRRYFLDQNVRAIYEKYPITKQHPGLYFRMTGLENEMSPKSAYGTLIPTGGLLRDWPGIMPQTWKFFAAPFGEQCHVKTASCAKYGLVAGKWLLLLTYSFYSTVSKF